MQKIAFLTLFSFCFSLFADVPRWYINQQFVPQKNYEIIGYGEGESRDEAVLNALENISRRISVEIDSTLTVKKSAGKSYQRDVAKKATQKTNSSITDYKILKSFYDGKSYYFALLYENLSFFDRFNRGIVLPQKDEKQNRYIEKTALNQEFEKKLDLKLVRKDGNWFLKYKEYMQKLDNKSFLKFFRSVRGSKVDLNLLGKKAFLKNGESFSFEILSKKSGFVSFLTVYENGTVGVLAKNIKVLKDKKRVFPNSEDPIELTAGLIGERRETFDLYVALFTIKKQSLEEFALADSELIEDERYKNFDELIKLLDKREFATLKVITKP